MNHRPDPRRSVIMLLIVGFRRLAPAPREAATGHLRCPYGAGHTGIWREGGPGRAAYLDGLTAGGEGGGGAGGHHRSHVWPRG
jgi:hypothetical protein